MIPLYLQQLKGHAAFLRCVYMVTLRHVRMLEEFTKDTIPCVLPPFAVHTFLLLAVQLFHQLHRRERAASLIIVLRQIIIPASTTAEFTTEMVLLALPLLALLSNAATCRLYCL